MWSEGENVIICDDIESSRLFKDEKQIMYNSKGTIRSIMDLWEKAKEINIDPLLVIKDKSLI